MEAGNRDGGHRSQDTTSRLWSGGSRPQQHLLLLPTNAPKMHVSPQSYCPTPHPGKPALELWGAVRPNADPTKAVWAVVPCGFNMLKSWMKPLVLIASVNAQILVDMVKSRYILSKIMIYFVHPVPGGAGGSAGGGCARTPLLPGFARGHACRLAETHLPAQVFLLAFLRGFVQLLKGPTFLAGPTEKKSFVVQSPREQSRWCSWQSWATLPSEEALQGSWKCHFCSPFGVISTN